MLFLVIYLRLDNSRDDMRVRGEILEREVTELQQRNEELTSLAQEAQAFKDEMDILRWDYGGWPKDHLVESGDRLSSGEEYFKP